MTPGAVQQMWKFECRQGTKALWWWSRQGQPVGLFYVADVDFEGRPVPLSTWQTPDAAEAMERFDAA